MICLDRLNLQRIYVAVILPSFRTLRHSCHPDEAKNLSANNFVNWTQSGSDRPSAEIPSAERRAYSTPVAPPTGTPCAANLPAFGGFHLMKSEITRELWRLCDELT
ncbi:MAG TPA: hypothetical protein PLY87_21595, partial [Planctomycetaceae bacterium]|nr:hypothetical protein [Planctomycetaceae bacterium]